MENINLTNKLSNKQVILFGELHGTRETPKLLFSFFKKYSLTNDFNIGLEFSSTFQDSIDKFLSFSDETKLKEIFYDTVDNDGRKSIAYFNFIKNIRKLNISQNKNIKIICVDVKDGFEAEDFQNSREKKLATNILSNVEKQLFVILGNIHVLKKEITFSGINIVPAGKYLYQKIKENLLTINIVPKAGEFYNGSVKQVDSEMITTELYDYTYYIDLVTPSKVLVKK